MSTNEKDALKRIRIANLSRLAELNGSRSRLAEILGKAPQQINDMIRGTKSFGARIAREIEDKLDLPPGTLDTENAELGNPQVSTIRFKRIPILSYVQAGMLTDNGQEQYDEWAIVPETLPEKTFALRVRGDSMSPNFQEGQLLFVDPIGCQNLETSSSHVLRLAFSQRRLSRNMSSPDTTIKVENSLT